MFQRTHYRNIMRKLIGVIRLPKLSLNSFELNDKNEVLISRDGWEHRAITTYRDDYYDELSSLTWTKTEGYLIANKLKNKKLHHYIMEKWYGAVKTQNLIKGIGTGGIKWIVEHMNNLGGEYRGFDNRIQCLSFAASASNSGKAFTFDIFRSLAEPDLIIHIYYDISVNRYQIAATFTVQIEHNGIPVKGFRLLYGNDFDTVINESSAIILEFANTRKIDIDKLRFIDDFEPVPIEFPYLTASGILIIIRNNKNGTISPTKS